MLNITETQSKNIVNIVGILKELEIEEKTSATGKDFVAGKAIVKVDQEINGKVRECEIPVDIYANKLTNSGTPSKLYPMIVKYKEDFTALAACPEDQPEFASKVVISGASLNENTWIDQRTGQPVSSIRIRSNFINKVRDEYEPTATFEVTGVILNKIPEEKDGEPTGRLKVKLALVQYQGAVDVIDLVAESEGAVNFIETNYEEGDTVNLTGKINMSRTTRTWYEEQGFGEPIKRQQTESCRELIILGGSPSGLEETYSYDANDIKAGLAARTARVQELKNKQPQGRTQTPKTNSFGF